MQNPSSTPPLTLRLFLIAAIAWALWSYPIGPYAPPLHKGLWWFGALCVALGSVQCLTALQGGVKHVQTLWRAWGPQATHGTAAWMTEREARQSGLHKPRPGSRFMGTIGGTAIWLWTETHSLILGPAGSQKTTAAIMNVLMGSPESALISDIKGELWQTTSAHRAKAFSHRCVRFCPTDPEHSVKINPLDTIAKLVEADDPAALTKTRGMALQLLPDPQGGGGQNQVFYQGGRELVVTAILAVVVVLPPEHRTLAMVYRALSDLDILGNLLETASQAPAMSGEIADMARAKHAGFFSTDSGSNTAESFRTNALLALEAFGPGNYLAALTATSTFDFADLKTSKVSVYIVIDYANIEVLGKFAGLLQFMATQDMVAAGDNTPVLFVLDEFCNAPLHTLPKILTLLRSAGVKCILATQDLDDIARVYSKHALETVLSETDIKQFLGGIRSKTTLAYLASYLGDYSEMAVSYGFGRDGVQENLNRTGRKLANEDELRRLAKGAQIVLASNLRPILAKKVQVFAIAPWRRQIGVNLGYGSKRKLLPVEVSLGWRGARVTRHGAKLAREIARATIRPGVNRIRRLLGYGLERLLTGTGLLTALVVLGLVYSLGLPNLRIEHAYRNAQPTPGQILWCRYVGPTSPGFVRWAHCPPILWRKTW